MELNHPEKPLSSEVKILEAAKNVFLKKGKSGTRMQEIADEAGINKSLLHYYYRSKDKLFGAVFKFAFSQFAPKLIKIFKSNNNIFEVIENFVDTYIDIASKNPFIPMFIINEFNKGDAGFITKTIKNTGINIDLLQEVVDQGKRDGLIRKDIDHRIVIINTISLCIFPIIARPLLEVIVFKENKNDYDDYLKLRKKDVIDLIINSIKK
jgi:TetR/AcrR family transcriptional regulator